MKENKRHEPFRNKLEKQCVVEKSCALFSILRKVFMITS